MAAVVSPRLNAQQPPKLARVGVLAGTGDLVFRDTFAVALRELGWVEGKNLVIDWRTTPKPEEAVCANVR